MTISALLRKTDIPFEIVILLIAGMALLITGTLLFPVSSGALPYYENGLYGLLLVMFALQIVTMGKTPFGDVRRSRLLLAVGAVIAAVGIVTCFVPDVLPVFPAACCLSVLVPEVSCFFCRCYLPKTNFERG